MRQHAHPLTGVAADYDALLKRIGEVRLVLLGEASHGTHEFYRERAEITKRLITEKAFTAVAVEADRPAEYKGVRPALPDSYEVLFHELQLPRFVLVLGDDALRELRQPRLERAIGVI
jgi:erythromycin esterase-like protein